MRSARAKASIELPREPFCLTVDQLAAYCQIGRHKADEWTHRAGFPVIREEGTILIPLRALLDWLDEQGLGSNERPAAHAEIARLPIRKRPASGGA